MLTELRQMQLSTKKLGAYHAKVVTFVTSADGSGAVGVWACLQRWGNKRERIHCCCIKTTAEKG